MKKKKIDLKRGKFYITYAVGIHPSLIYRKSKKKNRYDAIVFGTTEGKHRTKLDKPISEGISVSVIHNKPIRGTRKDFADKNFVGESIDKIDKAKIEFVKRKEPSETRRYKEYKKTKNKKST